MLTDKKRKQFKHNIQDLESSYELLKMVFENCDHHTALESVHESLIFVRGAIRDLKEALED